MPSIMNFLSLFVFCAWSWLAVAAAAAAAETAAPSSNKRVLFLTNSESGQLNPQLATAMSLVQNHPLLDVHLASFLEAEKNVKQASAFVTQSGSNSAGIRYHRLNAPSFLDAIEMWNILSPADAMHAPGWSGSKDMTGKVDIFVMPWNETAYEQIHNEVNRIINEVDPEIIVVDSLFMPATDAALSTGRRMLIFSANTLDQNFGALSPGRMFFRAPALGTAYPYPLPLWRIPANILVVLRTAYAALWSPNTGSTLQRLQAKGLAKSGSLLKIHELPWPFIIASKSTIEYPLHIPANVTQAGPILKPFLPVDHQDPELATWLTQNPSKKTILINLGSHVDYLEHNAQAILTAIHPYLAAAANNNNNNNNTTYQILWKFNKATHPTPYNDSIFLPFQSYIAAGALRLEPWLKPDIASILATGQIALMINHGGANSYNEALYFGVPQIALPMWVDCYDNAARLEWLGVGVWGSRYSAPNYEAGELGAAIGRVLGDGVAARRVREKAGSVGRMLREGGMGRDLAADAVASWVEGRVKKDDAGGVQDVKAEL